MNRGTPSSSALAQTGWNLGSENSAPLTTSPIAAPFNPCFFTAVSSSCTARSGACREREAKAANRSGLVAQSSASFSFWIFTICAARSRSRSYQNGLTDSTSMSMACESIAASRFSISIKASGAPLTGGNCSLAASAPMSAPASWKWQCEWTSMVLMRFPPTVTGSVWRVGCCACARCRRPQLQKTMPVAAAAPPRRKSRRVVMISASLIFFCGPTLGHAPGGQQGGTSVRGAQSASHRLDAGLGDDGTPFRHLVVDALLHAVGTVGDDLEAIVAQLLGDFRRLQDGERLSGEQFDNGGRRFRRREKALERVRDEILVAELDHGGHV